MIVITCMDTRIVAQTLFDLEEGDAHVICNAGGSAFVCSLSPAAQGPLI